MSIKGSVYKGILITLALTLIPTSAISAQKITSGSTCKVLNQKIVYLNKTYTCVKSGKKLVWNKGVLVVKPTPTPTPTPLPAEGSRCTKIGAKVVGTTTYMRYSWAGHSISLEEAIQKLEWRSFSIVNVSTSKSNNYSVSPVENGTCLNSGDTFDVSGGILECRWIAGKKLQWIKINTIKKTFTNSKSPVSIDICKLQLSDSIADRTGGNAGAGVVGFPHQAHARFKVAIATIKFFHRFDVFIQLGRRENVALSLPRQIV